MKLETGQFSYTSRFQRLNILFELPFKIFCITIFTFKETLMHFTINHWFPSLKFQNKYFHKMNLNQVHNKHKQFSVFHKIKFLKS